MHKGVGGLHPPSQAGEMYRVGGEREAKREKSRKNRKNEVKNRKKRGNRENS